MYPNVSPTSSQRINRGFFPFLLILLSGMTGCYTLNHRLLDAFQDKRGIFVPMFANVTDEIGAERIFTHAIVRELQSRGEVLVTSREQAAYTLEGTVTSISYTPVALSPTGFLGLQDYRRLATDLVVTASVGLSLVSNSTGKSVWDRSFGSFRRIAAPAGVPAPVGRTYNYEAPSSIGLQTQSIIESRYIDIARDVTRDMYDEMVMLFD